jgi:hypothetical protein
MKSAFYELPGGDLYRLLNMIRKASFDERIQILDTICQAPSAHAFAESFNKARQLPTSLQTSRQYLTGLPRSILDLLNLLSICIDLRNEFPF